MPKRGFLYSLLAIAIYLIGAIATSLILIQFYALLIIITIICLFLKGASSSSRSSSSTSDEQRGYLEPQGGVPISGRFQNDDTFYGDDGFTYKRGWGDNWRKL